MQQRRPFKIVRTVIFALVLREVRTRFSANRLGAFWFVMEPLAHIAVLLTIFTAIRGRTLPGLDFAVFFTNGIIPFLLFKNIALKGMEAVAGNKALFVYKQIKPIDAVVARAIVEVALMSCVYGVVMFCLAFWGGSNVRIYHPLEWLGVLSIGITLSVGLALIFCTVTEAMPEFKTVVKLAYMPLYFLSGVVLPIWLLPSEVLSWMLWIPFIHIIDLLRAATFEHYPSTYGINAFYPTAVAVIMLFLGLVLYRSRRLRLVAI